MSKVDKPYRVEIPYRIGQPIFLKQDSEQLEYRVNRVFIDELDPLILSLELIAEDGEMMEVKEIHCSKQKNILKSAGVDENGEEA